MRRNAATNQTPIRPYGTYMAHILPPTVIKFLRHAVFVFFLASHSPSDLNHKLCYLDIYVTTGGEHEHLQLGRVSMVHKIYMLKRMLSFVVSQPSMATQHIAANNCLAYERRSLGSCMPAYGIYPLAIKW
jgi:hypothetical protein